MIQAALRGAVQHEKVSHRESARVPSGGRWTGNFETMPQGRIPCWKAPPLLVQGIWTGLSPDVLQSGRKGTSMMPTSIAIHPHVCPTWSLPSRRCRCSQWHIRVKLLFFPVFKGTEVKFYFEYCFCMFNYNSILITWTANQQYKTQASNINLWAMIWWEVYIWNFYFIQHFLSIGANAFLDSWWCGWVL